MSLLKRITDLFVEGTEVYLGDDHGKPIVVWVNQLNSFETEDARMDGAQRRSERMSQLAGGDSPERDGLLAELSTLDTDKIAERFVGQRQEEITLDVYNDLETEDGFRELQNRCINLPGQLEEQNAASDDPRWAALTEDQAKWTKMIADARAKAMHEALDDAKEMDREDLIKAYVEKWREMATIDVFMVERRITEIWFALRECEAVDVGTPVDASRTVWDHAGCDHTVRLAKDRQAIRALPENVLAKVSQAIEMLKVNPREAGNSDAPASSSDSSGPAHAEAPSTPSTPDETPVAPRML